MAKYTRSVIQSSWTNGRCLRCQRTFRVYPSGVSAAQQSDTLKALSVLLYILGLSYQGVADLLEALTHPLCKSTVYHNVQAASERAIHLRQRWLTQQNTKVEVLGVVLCDARPSGRHASLREVWHRIDFTHVKRLGQHTIVAVATAILTGAPLTFDIMEDESAETITGWIRELAQTVGGRSPGER